MRSGFLRLLACCAACLAGVASAAVPTPIEIGAGVERVLVWPGLQVVRPADGKLAPAQAAELASSGEVMTIDSPNRILGRGILPYWALFSLHNPQASDQLRLLSVETTTQFDMRLFERDPAGIWNQLDSLADAAGGRIGGGTSRPVWALQLKPRATTELLLRIEGPAIVRFPVFLHHPLSFAEHERTLHIAVGIALGTCLFIAFHIGSMRRYLDDKAMPLFIYMLIADLVGALWLSGFLGELFPALPESILSPIGFAAYATLFGVGGLHARVYLNCPAWAPRLDLLLQAQGWLWLTVAPLFALALPVAARVLLVSGGAVTSLTLVVISVLAARHGVSFSRFIAAAWLTYLVSGASFLFARLVDNPLLWSSSALVLGQATLVAVFFGLAMSQRLIRQRDVLVAARQEAVMQREMTATLMRERGLLFAATNHDLRQPLLGVSLFADLLKSAPTVAERREHGRKLDSALKEVDELLIGIQQLASINEVSNCPVFETIGLDDLLMPLIEEYRRRSEYKRITLRYVPTRLSIITHIPYFQRIVRNVLSNALRYTEQGDRVLVGCRRGGGLRLIIADSGRGMSQDQTRLAFDAFQRFDTEMSIPDGFGLGLYSTKSLANVLGLEVRLRSQERRGTEVSIFMPPSAGSAAIETVVG